MFLLKPPKIVNFSLFKLFHTTKPLNLIVPKEPLLETEYLTDPKNILEITKNIDIRKGIGDIKLVHELKAKLGQNPLDDKLKKRLLEELYKIPNRTHPQVVDYGNEPRLVKELGAQKIQTDEIMEFGELTKKFKLVRIDQLGSFSGSKSYYLLGALAELETALVRYVVSKLVKAGFTLVSVPDILPRSLIEACGMTTSGTRSQVYSLESSDLCLSGTSEMALAGLLASKTLARHLLPLKMAAVSRCYRAETSNLHTERGLYRVHEFTKVEMFVATTPETSAQLLEELRRTQEEVFGSLGLYCRVLDMPPHELGAQAYRKYDIEAWLPGRGIWGELSSCSDCLDYQARRLDVKYEGGFVHTLNGTACAVPRLLIALLEAGQTQSGIEVPPILRPYLNNKDTLSKQKKVPELKLFKYRK